MSIEAVSIRGWTRLDAAAASSLDDAAVRAVFHAETWMRPARAEGDLLVLARAGSSAQVSIIPGSQSLDLRNFADATALSIAVEPGHALLIDARLWLRAPAGVSLSLIAPAVPIHDPAPTSEQIALWRSRGYAFIRGGLEQARVRALARELDRALDNDLASCGEENLRAADQFGALRNLSDQGPAFLELLHDNPAYALIDQIMPNGYVLQAYDGLVLHPGEGRYPWDFHTDLTPLLGASFPRSRTLAVNVLYYLDLTGVENGATWIVPHSHLCMLEAPQSSVLADIAVPASGEAGDILIFDSRLWHCAGTNRTRRPRRLIKTLFSEPWVRPALDYVRALSPEKWDCLSPRVRTILGESATPPASVAEYRRRIEMERAR